MIISQEDFEEYVIATFPDVTESLPSNRRVVEYCQYCKAKMGMIVKQGEYPAFTQWTSPGTQKQKPDYRHPFIVFFECPDCEAKRRWFLYEVDGRKYKVFYLPGDIGHEIDELPTEPPSLRKAYSEAIRAYDANCPMAAAAMIRRALQVITRDILGAPPGKLHNELKSLKGIPNKLGVVLSQDFHDNAYIIKETANQAAHPDEDPDLLDFDEEDARNLHQLFLEVVTEIFVVPAASRRAREEMMNRRKIKGK